VSAQVLIDELVELAAIPAPTFAEVSRIEWLERRLAGAPGRRYRDDVGNLIWTWGEGRLRLLVAAHVDTVFPLETPLRFEHEGTWLAGPGIGDNAAAVAVVAQVVGELLESDDVASGAVAFTVGEEGLGNLRGATAACAELEPEAVLAVEGHGLQHVIVDAVGSLRARVRVTGPGGHSWVDRGRASAIHALLDLGATLARRSTPEAPVNIGLVSGGRSVNTIAGEAELVVELRSLDEPTLERFTGHLAGLEVEPPLRVEIETMGRRPAGRLDRASPLLDVVLAVRADLGLADTLGEGSTDANAALASGRPALTLGVAYGENMHTPEERIDTASLPTGTAQLRGVLERLLTP
jgi:tripeptide aminopeptidase